ncbi:MAG: hypothetical protein IPG01_18965 [Chitinophagaceae bacterium]|nr:hypothetical protein [Chitinophagaceae bacterium]
MRRLIILFLFAIPFLIFISCKKDPIGQNTGDAEWIKVISDTPARLPGKIRPDQDNNLYCSYNYTDYKADSSSALIKLDKNGKLIWRKEFTHFTIYDFLITDENRILMVSYSNGMITLTMDTNNVMFGSYPLRIISGEFRDLLGVKLFKNSAGNYMISGTVFYRKNGERVSMAFLIEINKEDGQKIWMQHYDFPEGPEITVTGCAEVDHGSGYIMIGSIQEKVPLISSFFLLRVNEFGDSLWTKVHETSSYTSTGPDSGTYHGYYCFTSDIISSADNNFYACAYNQKYNLPNINGLPAYSDDDNSARILKINADGEVIDYERLKHDFQNMAADLVLTTDGGLLIGFNPIRLVGTFYVGKQSSFIARLNPDLTVQSVSFVQNHYYDYLGSLCAMPDGHYAIQTMIQSFGNDHFYLEIIKTNKNGNF